MKKICVIVNSRANYARIKSVLFEIKKNKKLSLQLVLGASSLMDRIGNLSKTVKKDGFKISGKVYSIIEGNNLTTMAKSTGLGIIELSNIFENQRPDFVLTVADRFETIATAIAASYMNIPLIHTQGGEVTGSIDESVRHAVTKLSNFHFPSTFKAKQNVIKMGEDKKKVFLTGCPSIDLAKKIMENKINLNVVLKKYHKEKTFTKFFEKDFIVVVQHPVTTEYNSAKSQIEETIKALKRFNINVLWLWPNIDAGNDIISKRLRQFREKENPNNIKFFKNFEPEDFLKILSKSKCILGNSSVAIRECSFLGIPAVNIGNRQNGRECGKNVLHSSHDHKKIIKQLKKQLNHGKYKSQKLYGDGNAAIKITKLIAKFKSENTQKILGY